MSMQPGIYYDLDIAEYHGTAGVGYISKSGLTDFAKAPAIYYGRHLDPNRPLPPAPTPAMMLGTMTHCAVLEPDCFDARHVIAPKVDRRTKAGKDEWQAFVATLKPGQEPADPDMAVQATAMAASILRIEPLRQLLAAGEAEVSAFYEDPVTGVRCRVRPDWVYPAGDAGVVIVDVKTCPDASAAGFAKSVANWSYDVQAAMYCDGYEAASGTSVHGFVFAVVEKDYPYGAAAYMLPEDVIDAARRRYRRHLQRFAECQQSGQWPGYTNGDEIRMLTMPAWAMKDDE